MITLQFDGGIELQRALDTLSSRISRQLKRDALAEAAEPMRKRMAQLAPFKAGKPDLRDAMVVSAVRGTDVNESAVAVGPTKAGFYGSFQEFGTKHHAAQPFARPAFDAEAEPALRVLADAMWRELAGRGIHRSVVTDVPVQDEV